MVISQFEANWEIDYPSVQFEWRDGLEPVTGSFQAFSEEKPNSYPRFYLEFASSRFLCQVTSINYRRIENGYALECEFQEAGLTAQLEQPFEISWIDYDADSILDTLEEKQITITNLEDYLTSTCSFCSTGNLRSFLESFATALGMKIRKTASQDEQDEGGVAG